MSRFATVDYALPPLVLAPWSGCPECSGGPTPGARALLAYYLEQAPAIATELDVDPTGIRSLGIYNCRPVRGASSLSIHACGRAVDLGIPVTVAGHRIMVEFLSRLAPHAESLGVQLVIFSRTSGSARNPWPTAYAGVHPHDDHAHVELTPTSAANLTLSTLRARVGDARPVEVPPPTPEPPKPSPAPTAPQTRWEDDVVAALPVVRFDRGDLDGPSAKVVQALLAARGIAPANSFVTTTRRGLRYVEPDGYGRARTRQALATFQTRTRTGGSDGRADLIVGPRTWAALLGTIRRVRFDEGVIRGGVVATVQALLAAQGNPPANSFTARGIPDRIGARHTRDALATFQRRTKTGARDGSADLIVGPATWGALSTP